MEIFSALLVNSVLIVGSACAKFEEMFFDKSSEDFSSNV